MVFMFPVLYEQQLTLLRRIKEQSEWRCEEPPNPNDLRPTVSLTLTLALTIRRGSLKPRRPEYDDHKGCRIGIQI